MKLRPQSAHLKPTSPEPQAKKRYSEEKPRNEGPDQGLRFRVAIHLLQTGISVLDAALIDQESLEGDVHRLEKAMAQ